jgi:oxygen-independent coproporphyrinogen-3 oxidase
MSQPAAKPARASADAARNFIERNLGTRQVNKILHSFPSPRLWQQRDTPVRTLLEQRRAAGVSRDLALYVGMPYCIRTEPDRCGYCLFPVEVYTGNKDLETYFGYLRREGELYRGLFDNDRLCNIYFGGGTANLYRADRYPELMTLVRDLFDVPAGISITLEGIPQLFSREKLEKIKESGMNRVSMGVQQMNDELNALSGRKQTVQHVLQSIEWCQELGLPCNVDLIFGWPRQTVSSMMKDLELLVSTGVHHITHYELNVGGPTDFALNRRHELPSVVENLEMYRVSRDYLTSCGYRQLTAYDWEKAERPEDVLYEECDRSFRNMDILGWGYAAVSQLEGAGDVAAWAHRNHTSVSDYFRAVDEGRIPAEIGFHYQDIDYRMSQLFRNLQGMVLDLDAYQTAFGIDLLEEHAGVWEALGERGFIEIAGRQLRIVGDGVFYTPMIQTLLSRERIAELSRSVHANTRALPVA